MSNTDTLELIELNVDLTEENRCEWGECPQQAQYLCRHDGLDGHLTCKTHKQWAELYINMGVREIHCDIHDMQVDPDTVVFIPI